MSLRYEVCAADETPIYVLTPEQDPDDHGVDLSHGAHAVVIGDPGSSAFAVTGTPTQLRAFAARIAAATNSLAALR